MLCEHESILRLNHLDNSQWITFAVLNLLLILFVQVVLPIIRSFMRESRLVDEEMLRRFREFYYAKFGPHFIARNSSPKTVIAVFMYLGINLRWLLACSFLSNVSLSLAGLTLLMWNIEFIRFLFSRLLRFVDQNGPSIPNVDDTTGMPLFEPDLMEGSRRAWSIDPDSALSPSDHTNKNSLRVRQTSRSAPLS